MAEVLMPYRSVTTSAAIFAVIILIMILLI